MKKTLKNLATGISAAGEKVHIDKDGYLKLPVSSEGEQEALFIQKDGGYRVIPLLPDIKRIYIEVTTKCNFACITCIRSSWEDCLMHMEWETFENILENLKELPDLESV